MAMKWNDGLSVGVDLIDNQHKELINRVNGLLLAMTQGKGRDEIGSVMSFLADYVVTHFRDEEALMAKCRYANAPAHKEQHVAFVSDFGALKNEFELHGPTSHLTMQIQRRVCDWLVTHIGQTDKLLGAAIRGS